MESSGEQTNHDLSFNERKVKEGMVLETVRKFEPLGGIMNHKISKETMVNVEDVDIILKDLVKDRLVMISRSGMNVFYLPYKEKNGFGPMPMPERIERSKAAREKAAEIDPEHHAKRGRPSKKDINRFGFRCPYCDPSSSDSILPTENGVRTHIGQKHKGSKVPSKIEKVGEAMQIPEKKERTIEPEAEGPSPTFREEVQMGDQVPEMPADRHVDESAAEISVQDLQQVIPQGMTQDRPVPTWGYGIHDILELVQQVAKDAGIRFTYVYGCTETDSCRRETLSMDLEG